MAVSACDTMCCKNELNLSKLCANAICADSINVTDLTATNINNSGCLPLLSSPAVCTASVISATADIGAANFNSLTSASACVTNLMSTNISADYITSNSACFSGQLTASNLLNCGVYRANVVYSAPVTYTLGSLVAFDTILDDPNSNITLAPTTYTVPVAGYYIAEFNFSISNITTTIPIVGIPTANPQLYVNGILHNESYSSFMSFFPQQKVILNSLLSLNKGDTITMMFNILALNSTNGVVPVSGTASVIGDGSDVNTSSFKIDLVSVSCAASQGATPSCAPVIPCTPVAPKTCVPCVPVVPPVTPPMSGNNGL